MPLILKQESSYESEKTLSVSVRASVCTFMICLFLLLGLKCKVSVFT